MDGLSNEYIDTKWEKGRKKRGRGNYLIQVYNNSGSRTGLATNANVGDQSPEWNSRILSLAFKIRPRLPIARGGVQIPLVPIPYKSGFILDPKSLTSLFS
jgi:hypothetical protein